MFPKRIIQSCYIHTLCALLCKKTKAGLNLFLRVALQMWISGPCALDLSVVQNIKVRETTVHDNGAASSLAKREH